MAHVSNKSVPNINNHNMNGNNMNGNNMHMHRNNAQNNVNGMNSNLIANSNINHNINQIDGLSTYTKMGSGYSMQDDVMSFNYDNDYDMINGNMTICNHSVNNSCNYNCYNSSVNSPRYVSIINYVNNIFGCQSVFV